MTAPKIPDSLRRVVLASNNAGKLREFSALFAPLGIELVPQGELGVPEAEEPHVTFVENALAKARHASRLTGLPALADDSGLCVAALDGAPGVYSARYAKMLGGEKSDQANNELLVRNLAGVADRSAWYVAVLALVRSENDPRPVARRDHRPARRRQRLWLRSAFLPARPGPDRRRPGARGKEPAEPSRPRPARTVEQAEPGLTRAPRGARFRNYACPSSFPSATTWARNRRA
jgi:non-canonical purine NTP pyrophosphatase (RdgB/HAM1 family)